MLDYTFLHYIEFFWHFFYYIFYRIHLSLYAEIGTIVMQFYYTRTSAAVDRLNENVTFFAYGFLKFLNPHRATVILFNHPILYQSYYFWGVNATAFKYLV